jgi:hypothetical protein
MGLALVDSYAVKVQRHQNEPAAEIELRATSGHGSAIRSISIFLRFLETFSMPSPGFDETERTVCVSLPYRDFDRMYHVLQTEAPVWAKWDATEEHPYFALSTATEPPGEGFMDEDSGE